MYEISEDKFHFWHDFVGLDTLFYDRELNKRYIIYWLGSILNNKDTSCASFMNWRDDGLLVKYMLQYTRYRTEEVLDSEEKITVHEGKRVFSIEEMDVDELNDHDHDMLLPRYVLDTKRRSLMGLFLTKKNTTITHMIRERSSIDGNKHIILTSSRYN